MVIFINEENSELRGKMFPIPEGVMKHLKKTLKEYEDNDGDKNNKGYDHLKWLVEQNSISTEEMKRIKNFFDNYKGTDKSDDYKLYGGKSMSDWVSATLNQATKVSKENKKAKKDAGLSNPERKTHRKSGRVHVGKPDAPDAKLSISLNETKKKHTVVLKESQYQNYLSNKQKEL